MYFHSDPSEWNYYDGGGEWGEWEREMNNKKEDNRENKEVRKNRRREIYRREGRGKGEGKKSKTKIKTKIKKKEWKSRSEKWRDPPTTGRGDLSETFEPPYWS